MQSSFITALLVLSALVVTNCADENISSCPNISSVTFGDTLTLKGDSFGIMKKSGNVLDSNNNVLLSFKTDCLAWSATDAQIFLPNSDTLIARLDQDNVAIGNRIRLRDCNDNIIAIFQEDIVSSIISLKIKIQYFINNPDGNVMGKSDAIHLFDTNMKMYQNNEAYASFDFPFGEAVKKMWLGEQSATLTFTNSSVPLGSPGEDRFLSVALGIYYLVLLSLDRDSRGNIEPPLCNQVYRTGLIIGITIGCVVFVVSVYLMFRFLQKRRN